MNSLDSIIDKAIEFGGFLYNGYDVKIDRRLKVYYNYEIDTYSQDEVYIVVARSLNASVWMNNGNPVSLKELGWMFDKFLLSLLGDEE